MERLIQSGPKGWFKLFGVWSVPVLIATSAFFLQSAYDDSKPNLAWFLVQNWVWYLWALLCPWAYHLVVRYPFGTRLWKAGALRHLVTALASAFLISAVYGVFRAVQYGDQSWFEGAIANVFRPSGIGNHIQTVVTYGLLVGGMYAIRASRQRRRRDAEAAELALRATQLESQLASAQLKSLQMQLQPHFFFNALNSIASLVEQQRNAEAFRTIGLLGELLRATLERTETHLVRLDEELAFLDKYLEIERVRFPERLSCSIQVEDGCGQALVPALVMQPVVENAIVHGVSKVLGATRIDVSARSSNGRLLLQVDNDGPGLPEGWSLEAASGIGLQNTCKRLQVHYGDEHRFAVGERADGGVRVNIEVPWALVGEDVTVDRRP